jgi:hypothetical protein
VTSEWNDYDGMVASLRSWVEVRGISHALLDELAGMAKGHTGKLLGEAQPKHFGTFTLLAMMATLGLKCRFVEDTEMVEQMRPHWEPCNSERRRTLRKARIGKVTLARVLPFVVKELGRRGAEARNRNLSPERRRQISRLAGLASGRARLRRGLMEAARKETSK